MYFLLSEAKICSHKAVCWGSWLSPWQHNAKNTAGTWLGRLLAISVPLQEPLRWAVKA